MIAAGLLVVVLFDLAAGAGLIAYPLTRGWHPPTGTLELITWAWLGTLLLLTTCWAVVTS